MALLDAMLWRPFRHNLPGHLVGISEQAFGLPSNSRTVSAATVGAVQGARSFERVTAFRDDEAVLSTGDAAPLVVRTTEVDTGFFHALGVRIQLGRSFAPQDRSDYSAVLSDQFWTSARARDTGIIGSVVWIGGSAIRVIGVAPKGFRFGAAGMTDVWLLRHGNLTDSANSAHRYTLIAQLAAKSSPKMAMAELSTLNRRLRQTDSAVYRHIVLAMDDDIIARNAGRLVVPLLFAIGPALLVLFVAASNACILSLMRATDRQAEMAIRASLGASRARLILLSLAESTSVVLLSGVVAVFLSVWMTRVAVHLMPNMPSWVTPGIDFRTAGAMIAVLAIAVLLTGISPAIVATSANLTDTLKTSGPTGSTPRGRQIAHLRGIGVQVAVATMALCATLLVTASYRNVSRADRGYQPDHVLAVLLSLDNARLTSTAAKQSLNQRLADDFANLSSVESVADVGEYCGLGPDCGKSAQFDPALFRAGLRFPTEPGIGPSVRRLVVSDNYFELLGIPLLSGRLFNSNDGPRAELVGVISRRLALAIWGRMDVLGDGIQIGRHGPALTVVGVVGDIRIPGWNLEGFGLEPRPDLYLSERQAAASGKRFLLHVRGPLGRATPIVAGRLREVADDLRGFGIQPLAFLEGGEATLLLRLVMILCASCTAIALILSLVGVYAVAGYTVMLRSKESAIRLALGASSRELVRELMKPILITSLLGVGMGLGGVAAGGFVVGRSLLWHISPMNPWAYCGTSVVIVLTVIAACAGPAIRAVRTPPMIAMHG
jgi:putative ABC transport system permease protein